jgi:methylated-DNA-[protein]-cysteine S-methyltransferase
MKMSPTTIEVPTKCSLRCIFPPVPEIIRAAEFDTPIGPIRFATSEKGLAHIALPHASGRGLGGWISSHAHAAKIREDADANHAASLQVIEYLEGERVVFELPLDLRGTEFQLASFEEIAAIPYGDSRSYRELATSLGNPNSMRAVGAAAGANPLPLVVPCHRVLGADGHLTGYSGGTELQGRLLAMERSRAGVPAERLF